MQSILYEPCIKVAETGLNEFFLAFITFYMFTFIFNITFY